jgi:hypothetical protein
VNERPTHINGRTYFIGSWQGGLRNNDPSTTWMLDENHVAWPVARIGGNGFSWPPQLNQALLSARPKEGDPSSSSWPGLTSMATIRSKPTNTVFATCRGPGPMKKGEQQRTNGFVREIVYP